MDSDWRHRVDLSQFFLFEATGDSELNSDDSGHYDDISPVDNDEDDAESCCSGPCGSLDDFMGYQQDQGTKNGDSNGFDDPDQYYINQENGTSEEVEMEHQQEKQGRASGDGNDNGVTQTLVLNEMEKNKLFWETCLAS